MALPGRPRTNKPNDKPLRWTPRHHRLVELAVLGCTNAEIAQKLNYTPVQVSRLTNRVEVMQEIDKLRRETRERSIGTIHDDLAKDARNTFDKLKTHRDAEDPDVSLRACSILFDRQIPKRTEVKEEQTVRIVLSHEDVAHLRQVEEEYDMDAEFEVEDDDGQPGAT